jgi:hypothetical protein
MSRRFDTNSNMNTLIANGQAFTLAYNAENQLVAVIGPSMSAANQVSREPRRAKVPA